MILRKYEFLITLLFLNIIGVALYMTHGHYNSFWILSVCVGSVILSFSILSNHIKLTKLGAVSTPTVLGLTLVIFSGMQFYNPQLIYSNVNSDQYYILTLGISLVLILSVIYVIYAINDKISYKKKCHVMAIIAIAIIVLHFLNKILTLRASPFPFIDTFTLCIQAAEGLVNGRNPYTMTYQDIYRGAMDYRPIFPYPPGILYVITPFWVFFRDIRTAYIAIDVGIVILLIKIAISLNVKEDLRWFFPLLWLSFPVSFFFLEQAWTDGIMALLIMSTFYSILKQQWTLLGIISGIALGTKQYAAVAIACVGFYIWRYFGFKSLVRYIVLSLSVCLVMLSPFLIWSWRDYLDRTIEVFISLPTRRDSFSLYAWFINEYMLTPPGFLFPLVVIGIFSLTQTSLLKERSKRFQYLVSSVIISYLYFFLLGKIAFCNYYYMVSSLVLFLILVQVSGYSEGEVSRNF